MNTNARTAETTAIELLNFPDDRRWFEEDPLSYLICCCGVYEDQDVYIKEVREQLRPGSRAFRIVRQGF